MMKNLSRALLTIAALVFSYNLSAQYMGASLQYVKVKPGQWNNYMQLEKDAKEFHQKRVEEGIITRWALYRKLYTGSEDPYQFILVSLNDDFMKTENAFPQQLIDANYSKEEQGDFMKRAGETRDIVKSEYYDRIVASENSNPYKYLRINSYYVAPEDRGAFMQTRKELVKPVFDEVVDQGHFTSWAVWKKDPYDKKVQYVSVDAYAEFGDWKKDIPLQKIFDQVFPNMDFNETAAEVIGLRTMVKHEYWELVMATDPISE
jgi:hypothetical protein